MTMKTKGLGWMQVDSLKALCARPAGLVLPWVTFGDTHTTERIGISLAKRGLVDGPTAAPASGYAQHMINATGREWAHDNIGPICGRRWTLTGEDVPQEEYVRYIDHCVALTLNEIFDRESE